MRVNGASMERFLQQCKQAVFGTQFSLRSTTPFIQMPLGGHTLLYLLHQLVRNQFELLDQRESELTMHESSGFDSSAHMTFLGLSFHFAR